MRWVMTGLIRTGNKERKSYERWSCFRDGRCGCIAMIFYSREHGYLDVKLAFSDFISKDQLEGKSIEEAQALVETILRLEECE